MIDSGSNHNLALKQPFHSTLCSDMDMVFSCTFMAHHLLLVQTRCPGYTSQLSVLNTELVCFVSLLVVIEREKGVLALHLPTTQQLGKHCYVNISFRVKFILFSPIL